MRNFEIGDIVCHQFYEFPRRMAVTQLIGKVENGKIVCAVQCEWVTKKPAYMEHSAIFKCSELKHVFIDKG